MSFRPDQGKRLAWNVLEHTRLEREVYSSLYHVWTSRAVRSLDGTRRPHGLNDCSPVVDLVVVLQVLPDRRHHRQGPGCQHSPTESERRVPRVGFGSHELGALLVQAGLGDLRDGALITLLALNGLRIFEALNTDIDDL